MSKLKASKSKLSSSFHLLKILSTVVDSPNLDLST